MEPTARTLDEFVALISQKGLSLAVITPTSSFIGTHLAEALLAQNIAVLCEEAKDPETIKYAKHLEANPYFFLLEHSHQHALPLSLPTPKYIIYDLDATFAHFAKDDDLAFGIALETKRIIEYAVSSRAVFIVLSRLDEPADTIPSHKVETSLPFEEKSHKTELKHFIFTLIAESMQKTDLNARIVSYSELYGPRMDIKHVQTKTEELFSQAVSKHKMTILGDGLAAYGPVYISDFIYGVVKLLFLNQAKGKTYHFINPRQTNLLHFAHELQQVAASIGISLAITFSKHEANQGYYLDQADDVQKMHDLGWEPKVETHLGLLRTLSFFFPKQPEPELPPAQAAMEPAPAATLPQTVYPSIGRPKTKNVVMVRLSQIMHKVLSKLHVLANVGGKIWPKRVGSATQLPLTTYFEKSSHKFGQSHSFRQYFKNTSTSVGVLLIVAGLLILLPTLLLAYYTNRVNQAMDLVAAKPSQGENVSGAHTVIEQANTILTISSANYALLGKKQMLTQDRLGLSGLLYSLAGLGEVDKSYQSINAAFLRPNTEASQSVDAANAYLSQAQDNFMMADAIQKLVPIQSRFGQAQVKARNLQKAQQANIISLENLIAFFNLLYSGNKQTVFVVLVVDNNELRPSGGVVSGALAISIRQGMRPTVKAYDFSDTDFTSVAAPRTIQTYLRRSTMMPEDVLWYPTLHTSISPIYNALATVIGQPVNGVLSIDLSGLKELVELTGPITIINQLGQVDQTDVVSAQNFDSIIANLYQTQVFATQQKRNQYITSMSQAIINQTLTMPLSQAVAVISTAHQQQHLLADFNDAAFQNFAQAHNWADPLTSLSGESVGIFDANIGFNKVNAQVKRTIHQDFIIDQNLMVNGRLIITYTNTSRSPQWPQGTYQSLTSLLLPEGYTIQRIAVDNKTVQNALQQTDLTSGVGAGALVSVLPGSKATLIFEYKRTEPLTAINGKLLVTAQMLKQSGTQADPYELALQYPQSWRIISAPQGIEQFADGLLVKTTIDTTKSFSFTFSK